MSSVQDQVTRIIADQLGITQKAVTAESAFTTDLNIDARQSALLRRQIEQQLNIELPKDDAKGLATVGDLIAYVEERTG
ncbi:acyl carrier protein [Streptomyces sp. MNP-20]|uniref:acyl carrier protein n=1 Tax=Streptomyces sp. MNP-20 TaxID=2721165 RepID=UPI001556BCF9|nr:acyl carrier protein [Streptomyces sp. MNP-20]